MIQPPCVPCVSSIFFSTEYFRNSRCTFTIHVEMITKWGLLWSTKKRKNLKSAQKSDGWRTFAWQQRLRFRNRRKLPSLTENQWALDLIFRKQERFVNGVFRNLGLFYPFLLLYHAVFLWGDSNICTTGGQGQKSERGVQFPFQRGCVCQFFLSGGGFPPPPQPKKFLPAALVNF